MERLATETARRVVSTPFGIWHVCDERNVWDSANSTLAAEQEGNWYLLSAGRNSKTEIPDEIP